jgi:hypothetical protein
MNRTQAFEKMIYLKDSGRVIKKLKINYQTLYSYRHRHKKGIMLTGDKEKELLLKFGFKLVKEEKWELPL